MKQLVLFDLAVGGHHGTYIWHLVKYWTQVEIPATLNIVVTPKFLEQHLEVVDWVRQHSTRAIRFISISADEAAIVACQSSIVKQAFTEWKLFCQYARQLQADQGLLMQIDHLQLPIIFGERSPCAVGGIYFRPTFHYVEFKGYQSTWKDAIRRWRQKWLLALALKSRQINVLFSLDPFAVSAIADLSNAVKVTHLADPVVPHPIDSFRASQLRTQLNIDPDRNILLLFGKLSARKGTNQLLEAIRQLPEELAQNLCLLMVGQIQTSEETGLKSKIAELSAQSPVQLMIHDEFVSEQDMPLYFQIADIVMAPYQQHVGMSGILLQAAAAQKPVIASNYGLMGELVRRYQLGSAIDAEQPTAIAHAIKQMLNVPAHTRCDPDGMAEFVQCNSAKKFAEVLCAQLLNDLPMLNCAIATTLS